LQVLTYSYGGIAHGDEDDVVGGVVVVAFDDGIDFGRPHIFDSVVLTKARLGLFGSHIALCAGVRVEDCGTVPWPSAIFNVLNSNAMLL
jgi:hypothetical protein